MPETMQKARPGWALMGMVRRRSHKRWLDVKVRPETGFTGRADLLKWICGKENRVCLSLHPKSLVTNVPLLAKWVTMGEERTGWGERRGKAGVRG